MTKAKKHFFFTILLLTSFLLNAQESLKSIEEDYYDFLSLTGVVKRPTLGYRTLSDSVWNFKDVESFEENEDGTFTKVRTPGEESAKHLWKNNNLGTTYTLWEPAATADNWFTRGLKQGITARIYGPEWFNSYNSAAPYGQNDGGLWQGRGYNTALTAGLRLEGYGFELTFKPQISWSQNKEFEYIQPNYSGEAFKDKADTYGYYGVRSIDAPQRFGDTSFWNYDWGDTELRYSWKTFTVGFGTQAIWLGPAKLNPIIHSNNAASYPKIDFGLRKTNLIMPYFGWDLGSIEFRGWWGKLSESDWFDNDDKNNHNLISGFSINYEFPYIFKGLSFGFNRIMLSKWNNINPYSLFRIYIPNMDGNSDSADQRFSATVSYLLPKIGMEVYFEWARNDFSPNIDYIIRYPFHTQAWSIGAQKTFHFSNHYSIKLLLEVSFLENSADYDRLIDWYTTFYCHGEILQGHTNRGQWLGAGIGTGGNSQYLGIEFLYPSGSFTLFVQRRNPDLDYTMYIDSRKQSEDYSNKKWTAEANIRANFDFGMNYTFFATQDLIMKLNFVFNDEHNPLNYNPYYGKHSSHRLNFVFGLNIHYIF
ncbi:Capsule assembly protein Wzi [Treponema bryantii]|uniref:Capsule assembly protein Wzi n=1 Tax=Treponema bryantii TaxID=163 RepID=A0A1H9J469_9SPIR|nr:hypothetical protein [Treponema bryantii]SEQ81821.1 Capsule assembly protein Wzi [Treponema bryantii]